MVTLLEAAKDSERTYRESLLSTYRQNKSIFLKNVEKYQNSSLQIFDTIQSAPLIHENPILRETKGSAKGNKHTFESKKQFYLPESEIQEFYDNGYIAKNIAFLIFLIKI